MKKLLLLLVLTVMSCSTEDVEPEFEGVEAYQITLAPQCQTGELTEYCINESEFNRVHELSKPFVGPSSCLKVTVKTTHGDKEGYLRGMHSGNMICQ